MKKIVCILSMLAALGLASCGGAPESSSSSTPTPSSSSSSSSSSSTRPSSSSTPAPSSSSSSTPAEPTRPATYAGFAYWAYEGSTRGEDFHEDVKWDKGATWTWTFTANKAVENAWLTIGAKMTNSSHADRTLFTNSNGASSSDAFESNPENDGTPRLNVNLNGEDKDLTNTKTYGDVLSTDEYRDLDLVHPVNIKEGRNVLKIGTNANVGYRLYLGEQVRFFYEGTGLELTLGAPAEESTDTTPVESSDTTPVESSELPPEESSELPPEESSELPPEESSEVAPHEHVYTEKKTALNRLDKVVTLYECEDDDAKEIAISFTDYTSAEFDATKGQWTLGKNKEAVWHIDVDKDIEGAEIYFESKMSDASHAEMHFVAPEGESEGGTTRAEVCVGDYAVDAAGLGYDYNLNSYGEAGLTATEFNMYFLAKINLKAGENKIVLHQNNVGYRLMYGGSVHIRYNGDATIKDSDTVADAARIVFADGTTNNMVINEAAGSKEYMIQKIDLAPNKPFMIYVAENNQRILLGASELKAGLEDVAEATHELDDSIVVKEAGKYDIYVGVKDLSNENKYKCIWISKLPERKAGDPVEFMWDSALQTGSGTLDGTKFNKNATYTFKVDVPEAGNVILKFTMMGSKGNGAKILNSDGQDFTVTANGQAAEFLGKNKTYAEFFGEDQEAWVEVSFAAFAVEVGELTLQIKTGNGGYRVNVDKTKPMSLNYVVEN